MCGTFNQRSLVRFSPVLRVFGAILVLNLAAALIAAQGSGDSVFIINQTTTNNAAGVVADYLAGEVAEGLQEQFPCVDYSSPEDVKAVLDALRDKQLLGAGDVTQEQLAEIAGSIGARFIVLVSVTVLPNGQTTVSARLLDTKTGMTVANESETAADAEAAFATAESVAKKLMQKFSAIFKNKCEPHWTGSIAYSRIIQASSKKESSGAKSQRTETRSKNLSATTTVLLQPMSLGFSTKYSAQARVTQTYRFLEEFSWAQTGDVPCREPGRNTTVIKLTDDFKRIQTESGSDNYVVTVMITIFEDGRYKIEASGKPIKTIVKVETSGNEVRGCRTVPFSNAKESENANGFPYISLEGRIDPKNPNVLSGKKVEGDLETGQQTWSWNLRLVEPNKKKQSLRKTN